MRILRIPLAWPHSGLSAGWASFGTSSISRNTRFFIR